MSQVCIRHTWQHVRFERASGHPLIRKCLRCNEWQRWHRGRFVKTTKG